MGKFAAGFGTAVFCFILAAFTLRLIVHSNPRIESVGFLINKCERWFTYETVGLEGNVTPTPDPPVVVRGGSLNFLDNLAAWAPKVGELYFADLRGTPKSLFIDGVTDEKGTGGCGTNVACHLTLTESIANNWTIQLTTKPDRSGKFQTLKICTQLNPDGTACSDGPNGVVNSTGIYIDGGTALLPNGQSALSVSTGLDRANARLHFAFPGCSLVDSNGNDQDPPCDLIHQISLVEGGSKSGDKPGAPLIYKCIDGACDLKIDTK
jgi:hypothetical protein